MGLTKKQSEKLRTKAYGMYLNNESTHSIAKQIGVDRKTVDRWVKKYNWKDDLEDTKEKVIQMVGINVLEQQERSLKLINALESKFAQKLQNGDLDGYNISSFAQLQRVKHDIITPRTQTQFNFTKQENNIGLSQEDMKKIFEVLNDKELYP